MAISLLQLGYTSEWALAKFFPILLNDPVSELFELVGICGRGEDSDTDAVKRLLKESAKRRSYIENENVWRYDNILQEDRSCMDLIGKLSQRKLEYFQSVVDGQIHIPQVINFDAIAIFTSNNSHLDYIRAVLERKEIDSDSKPKKPHTICEKPLVVVTDDGHRADRSQLNELERLVYCPENKDLILIDSEHYSAKKASRIFYERIGDMVAKYGSISRIEACTKERDDPDKERTRKLLCTDNRTGLLLDMGVHLFGMISNIDGFIGDIRNTDYAVYPEYDVETYVKTNFSIYGNLFHEGASGSFEMAKFIHKMKQPYGEEHAVDEKKFLVTFEDRNRDNKTVVTIDFSNGTVTDSRGYKWYDHSQSSNQEYANILRDFHNAITRMQDPRTSFKRSIKNLKAICRVYEEFPFIERKNHLDVYDPSLVTANQKSVFS